MCQVLCKIVHNKVFSRFDLVPQSTKFVNISLILDISKLKLFLNIWVFKGSLECPQI